MMKPKQIGLISRPYGESSIQGFDHILAFARAIEDEVRKQDEALILQLVEALESVDDAMPFPVARQVLKVARARLEGKP